MSFDRLAPHYDWMEWALAGEKLQRMRTRWLGHLPPPRLALLAGEGHGRFLVELRRHAPAAEIICADSSATMLSIARRRLKRSGLSSERVQFVQMDLQDTVLFKRGFDLVVTNFFLDCFPAKPLAAVVGNLADVAAWEANWLLADFCEPTCGIARLRARCLLAMMYAFFRQTTRLPAKTLTPPDPLLSEHGFELRARNTAEWGLLHADWWRR